MLSYDAKHSKQRKTWKVTKIPWIASIWWQNDQNNAKLQKWSKYNDLHRFDDKTIITTQNYESYRITMNCIDLTTKRSNMFSYFAKHWEQRKTTSDQITMIASISRQNEQKCWVTSQTVQNNAKLQKRSNYYEFASIWRQKDRKCWVTSKNIQNNEILRNWSKYNELHRLDVQTIKTTQNTKSDQNTMDCIDLMSKRSKQRKTTKAIELR